MNTKLEVFSGHYITHKPDIRVFDIDENDKYVILATDGLWDELKEKDVSIVSTFK